MTSADFIPPPPPDSPPAFLSEDAVRQLAQHGHLSITLPEKLRHDIATFFTAVDSFFVLPQGDKAALYPGTPANLEEGYHLVPDEKQFVSFRHAKTHANGKSIDRPDSQSKGDSETQEQTLKGGHAEVEALLAALWHDISHLLFRILFDVGRFIGIDSAAWYPLVRRALSIPDDKASMTPSLLRAFRYEPDKGISEPHLDVGLLTLCLGRGKGLELWERNTASMSAASGSTETTNGQGSTQISSLADSESGAKPVVVNGSGTANDEATTEPATERMPRGLGWSPAAEATILVGETLRVLSTNRVWAGLHRVVPNERGRDSIVFALRPDLATRIDLQMFGGEGHVLAGTLWEMIRKGKYNVNADKEVREETKAKNRREREAEKETNNA